MESTTRHSHFLPRSLAADLPAALVVFLVAVPLCLGVALASGAPLFAGLLSGIIGGVVVGAISGSHTSVSGPAAGLTAVVAAQIAALGSFEAFLLAVLFAGLLQIAMGVFRTGSIAVFIPSSVIKGLLAAIGLILVLKQLPHLFGRDTVPAGEMSFRQVDHENTFSELGEILHDFHPGAAAVGLCCLALLLLWNRHWKLRQMPVLGLLTVVLTGVVMGWLLNRVSGIWAIGATHLVQVPEAENLAAFFGFLRLPDFSFAATGRVYLAAVTIAAVASLETLLNIEAVDKLDPQRRISPPNRELMAQGIGNVVAGLVGGLPVTSVIVRSSVGISAGGETKATAIVHGLLLLLSVALLPGWLNQIPLSCLAAVLIVTGMKLARPSLFRLMWREGPNQFLPFVATVTAIIFTDLLIGILIGLGISILFILRSNLRRPVRQIVEGHIGGDVYRVELGDQVSFLNRAALSKAFNEVPRGGHLLIDARRTNYIDADVQDLIWETLHEIAPAHDMEVSMIGLKDHYEQLQDRIEYVDYTTRDLRDQLTPDQVLRILQEGNERFRTGRQLTRDLSRQLEATADTQHPLAIVLSGASSRTPIEMIFDAGLGEVYSARVIGSSISRDILGSLEHACFVAGARLIIVMGHRASAACHMAIEEHRAPRQQDGGEECKNLGAVIAAIRQSIVEEEIADWETMDLPARQAAADDLYRRHIERSIGRIHQQSPALAETVRQGRIKIVGALYDVRTGTVEFFGD